jgi:hypothetical protein
MEGFPKQSGVEVGGPSCLKKMEERMAERESLNTDDLQGKMSATWHILLTVYYSILVLVYMLMIIISMILI